MLRYIFRPLNTLNMIYLYFYNAKDNSTSAMKMPICYKSIVDCVYFFNYLVNNSEYSAQ